MAKTNKSPKQSKKKRANADQKLKQETPSEEINSFDFGGMQIKDLKKNLGCG